jgi:Polyketide cyclase / dehydrase and lipid transport
MKPVTVSATTSRRVEEVHDFLDVLANHEGFLDHLFTDWEFSGPRRGVGAKGEARQNVRGAQDWTEFEVVESEPTRIVERGIGNKGKRVTRGTYTFEPLPEGGTRISFELAWEKVSKAEGLVPPLTREFVRRANGKSMRRLVKQLDDRA